MATAIALPVDAPVPVNVPEANDKDPATAISSATPVAAPVTVPPEVYAVYEVVFKADP